MNYLAIALLVACVAGLEAANNVVVEKAKPGLQAVYNSGGYPYNYRQYGVGTYDYDVHRRYDTHNYGAYPGAHDLGSHSLHIPGGVYRPHAYDDAHSHQYRPYSYDGKYYDRAASRYGRYPYANYRTY